MRTQTFVVLAVALALAVQSPRAAKAQQGSTASLHGDTLTISLHGQPRPGMIRKSLRPPIPFRPFTIADIRDLAPSDSVAALGGSNRVPSAEFLRALNLAEQRANSRGYSLRTNTPGKRISALTVPGPSSAQASRIRAAHRARRIKNTGGLAPIPELQRRFATELPRIRPLLIPQLPERRVDFSAPWDLTYGNDWFAVYDRGSFSVGASLQGSTLHCDNTLGGSVIGNNFEAARVTIDAGVPRSGPITASLDFTAMGNSVYNLSESVDANSWQASANRSQPFDVNADVFNIDLGIVDIGVKAGVRGRVGLEYFAGLVRPTVTAWYGFNPSAHSAGYVQVYGGAFCVDVKAGGELTFLNENLDVTGFVGMEGGGAQPTVLAERVEGFNCIRALDGKLYAQACVDCWVDYCPDWARFDIYSWDGVQACGDIFQDDRSVKLADPVRWTASLNRPNPF